MSLTVCVTGHALRYPELGGHFWAYLNWALGLRALGCTVTWLEALPIDRPEAAVVDCLRAFRRHLAPYGLADRFAVYAPEGTVPPGVAAEGCLDLDAAAEADLLLDLVDGTPAAVVGRFRRSALVDGDPGQLQLWMHRGEIEVAPHDRYFTVGEGVVRPGSAIPDAGIEWTYTPPCVSLDWWPVREAPPDAPWTTVSQWGTWHYMPDLSGALYLNDKRTAFLPFLDLPRGVGRPMELTLMIGLPHYAEERGMLERHGWRVRDAHATVPSPWDYQAYVSRSYGEFSCAKPAYVRMATGWVSDRTVCYLASGKPAVVQDTGPSSSLPHGDGLFRFRDVEDARRCLEAAAADYERHCRLARALAEEHFDARRVVTRVLELTLS
ncbi:MAG TPA: hypothetical protein VF406_09380 [Thermodesulfobacteriota bacterium]